jgi:hypothetical protein
MTNPKTPINKLKNLFNRHIKRVSYNEYSNELHAIDTIDKTFDRCLQYICLNPQLQHNSVFGNFYMQIINLTVSNRIINPNIKAMIFKEIDKLIECSVDELIIFEKAIDVINIVYMSSKINYDCLYDKHPLVKNIFIREKLIPLLVFMQVYHQDIDDKQNLLRKRVILQELGFSKIEFDCLENDAADEWKFMRFCKFLKAEGF